MKHLVLLTMTLALAINISFAAKKEKKDVKPYPTGCQVSGFEFKHGALLLKADTKETPQAIFFIHNISKYNIKFHQSRTGNEPYVIHSNQKLKVNQWAAYATDKKITKFVCTSYDNKKTNGKVLDCEKALKICQYPKVEFAVNNRGNYWATTNRTKNSAVRAVIRQGTLLRWW